MSKEPDADFKEVGRQFITVFKRKAIKKVGSELVETTQKTTQKNIRKRWSEKWSEKWSETLSERQKEILKLIINNPKISRKELSEHIGINQSAIQKHLDTLKRKNIIKRIGPAKGGHWEVVGSNTKGA